MSSRRHVFSDLKPYICTHGDCQDFLHQYSTRDAWADHEFSKHRHKLKWQCLDCSEKCGSTDLWLDHMDLAHDIKLDARSIDYLQKDARRVDQAEPKDEEREFVKHVCQHMEEIALMALPSIEDDEEHASSDEDSWSYFDHPWNYDTNLEASLNLSSNIASDTPDGAYDRKILHLPELARFLMTPRNAVPPATLDNCELHKDGT